MINAMPSLRSFVLITHALALAFNTFSPCLPMLREELTLTVHEADFKETLRHIQQKAAHAAFIKEDVESIITQEIKAINVFITTAKETIAWELARRENDQSVVKIIIKQMENAATQAACKIAIKHLMSRFKEYMARYPNNALRFFIWKQSFIKQLPQKIQKSVWHKVEEQIQSELRKIAEQAESEQAAYKISRQTLCHWIPQEKALIDSIGPTTLYDPDIKELLKSISKLDEKHHAGATSELAELSHQSTEELGFLVHIMYLHNQGKQEEANECAARYAQQSCAARIQTG
jgi:hypothetical protein